MIVAPLAVAWVAAIGLGFLDGRRLWVQWACIAALAASLALAGRLAAVLWRSGTQQVTTGGWPEGLGITLTADALGVTFVLVSTAMLLVSLVYHAAAGEPSRQFPGLVLFMAAGLTGVFLTGDAFNFYVFFEVAMASAFAMSSHGDEPDEVRAGVLFVALNIFGSALFLMAIGSLYRLTGTLELGEMAARLAGTEAPRAAGAAALLLAAFSLKLGLFPFHTWLPDVYRDMRPEVAAIFAGALANIGSYGLLRFGGTVLPGEVQQASSLLLALGAASIVYGGVSAIGARTANAVLSFSAIGQAGYVLIAVALEAPAALAAALVYAVVNSLNKTLLFLASGLRGPAVAAAFAAGAFSLAGVPPFAGFAAKAAVFRSGVMAESWLTLAALLLGSGLTFVYIFSALQREFWSARPTAASPVAARALVVMLAIGLAVVGAWPAPLIEAGAAASRAVRGLP